MGIVFNIQRFSVQDGPGTRTTVFLKGCPLRCLWCSNPESQNPFPEVAHRDSLCNQCGQCVKDCPEKAITLVETGIIIDRSKCNNCGQCVEACVPGAIRIYGEEKTMDEVFREVVRDKPFYQNSGGGVTVSGGEPLMQAEFTAGLLQQCQEAGIHTCLETCGLAAPNALDRVLPYTDLLLYDIKLIDPAMHLEMTGKSNETILQNLKQITDRGVSIIIRIPIIPGISDSEGNLAGIARYVAGLDSPKKIELLQYHRLGEGKYPMLDKKYELSDLIPQDRSQLLEATSVFKRFNMDYKIVE